MIDRTPRAIPAPRPADTDPFPRPRGSFALICRLWLHLLIVVLGLLLLFFANPNRLAHDQIYHRLFHLIHANPTAFQDDYLFSDPRRVRMDSYFAYEMLGVMADGIGSEEVLRWLLVPLAFIIFTSSFFELIYAVTGNHLASLAFALLANWHIPNVFTGEWGLPGPSELDPWVFVQALLPLLTLALFFGLQQRRPGWVAAAFLAAGALGNIHIISTFYWVGTAALTGLFTRGWKLRQLFTVALLSIAALLASLPFLLTHAAPGIPHPTAFDPQDPEISRAIDLAAYHVTLPGRLTNARPWLVSHWYVIWPLVAIFVLGMWTRRHAAVRHPFLAFSWRWIAATVIFNIGFSLVQVFRLVILRQLPFWNEPRGFQFVYLTLIPAAALLTVEFGRWLAARIPRPVLAVGALLLAGGVILGISHSMPELAQRYRQHITPRYRFATCDANLYRFFATAALPPGPVLIDPDAWSGFRICTGRAVVVHDRDRAVAYSFGTDLLRAWYRRSRDVTAALLAGGDELLRTAERYGAQIIVSRGCAPVPAVWLAQRHDIPGEACVYVLKTNAES